MLTETMISSFLLSMIVVMSAKNFTSSLTVTSRASDINKKSIQTSIVNDDIRHQISLWRREGDIVHFSYDVNLDECTNNLAKVLLDEMDIDTTASLEPNGHTLTVRQGDNATVLLLPQSGWCP